MPTSSGLLIPELDGALQDVSNFETLFWDDTNTVPKPTLEQALAAFESAKGVEAMRLMRQKRNELLKESDIYALPDFPHSSDDARAAWLAYRAALRNMTTAAAPTLTPDNKLDESSLSWPAKP